MFNPKSSKDRINYGDALLPPLDYQLEYAVGTTYSLDLETLTAISISLGLNEDTDSELMNNSIGMLNALQKVSNKITVFCEAGQIRLPGKNNALCLLLEKMVVPVKIPYNRRINRYPAFHPKIWLLEYVNSDGDRNYRFVILSRNMTFDHSWDIACSLEGKFVKRECKESLPLQAFFRFLRKNLDKELADYERQNRDLTHFINLLPNIKFEIDDRFYDYAVLPLGIGSDSYKMSTDSLLVDNFHELVVMTPFLSGSVIEEFNRDWKSLTGTRRTLITRKSELKKLLPNKASNFDVYVMKDDIVDGESALSEGDQDADYDVITQQDIHAKLYIRRKGSLVELYIGSMNASYAAINSNVEMVLYLQTRNGVLNGEKFLNDIMGEDRFGKRNPFELTNMKELNETSERDVEDTIEQIIKKVCRFKANAIATEEPNGKYTLQVHTEIDTPLEGVTLRPLRIKQPCDLERDLTFSNLNTIQLSEFYVVSVTKDDYTLERVIMIPTEGIPDLRDADIIRSVITNRRAFIEYVAFVLGDDYFQSYLENSKTVNTYGEWDKYELLPAVYEKMLKASISHPERIQEIQYITRVIEDDTIIPPEFHTMYKVFCDTLGIK